MSKFPNNAQYRISADFCKRLKSIMDDNDCSSNKEFAVLVGVSTPVISKAANFGIVPSLRSLIKIADKLELSIRYLLGLDEKNEFIPSAAPSSFHVRIAELTKEEDTKYSQIANQANFPRTYIYEWMEQKTLPSVDFILDLSNVFKVSPDYLLGRTDYKK